MLQEYNQNQEQYTGCQCEYRITYILYGGSFGIENGYVVMSLVPISNGERINLMQSGILNHITYGKS